MEYREDLLDRMIESRQIDKRAVQAIKQALTDEEYKGFIKGHVMYNAWMRKNEEQQYDR